MATQLFFSQVGINTVSPNATLDVTARSTDGSRPEGILPPRLTGDQIKSADSQYVTAQNGTLIYATAPVTNSTPKTVNITAAGYYFFDGSVWKKMLATVNNNSWLLADTALSSSINQSQSLTLVTSDSGPYELVNNTTLTITVPTGYSQNKVVLRWDIWGSSYPTPGLAPSQGSLRYAVRQQLGSNTPTQIVSIMMSGWVNAFDTGLGPRWNAPVVYTINNPVAGTYKFDLMVHREGEINTGGANIWGAQGKADVYVK
nr:hypothetical protein [uncultured Chryseobacterium sp.]